MSFLSSTIVDAIVKLEGSEELVGVATVTLPDIEGKTEEMSGLGVGNFEEVVTGLYNSMSLTLKFRGMAKNNIKTKGKSVGLVITAAIQGRDKQNHEAITQKVLITVKGTIKSSKEGEISKGGKIEPERTLSLTYYKLEVDGDVHYEIDVFNQIAVIDGENILEAVNSILGR
ncbi:MAG: phage major tail tube protein [Fusobacteriaceae bacterium]